MLCDLIATFVSCVLLFMKRMRYKCVCLSVIIVLVLYVFLLIFRALFICACLFPHFAYDFCCHPKKKGFK